MYGRKVTKTDEFEDVPDDDSDIIETNPLPIVNSNESSAEIESNSTDSNIPFNEDTSIQPSNNPLIMSSKTRSGRIFNITVDQALNEDHDGAMQSIIKELKQIIHKEVWHPISYPTPKTIPCKIFLKRKLIDELLNWKARLVAGGHMQIKVASKDKYSPTAHITSIFLIAYIAAQTNCYIVTLDITGAYLNAKMTSNIYTFLYQNNYPISSSNIIHHTVNLLILMEQSK